MAEFFFRAKSDLQIYGKKFIFKAKGHEEPEKIEHTIILIHAFPFSSDIFVPNFTNEKIISKLNDIASKIGPIQVILPDLPGFGQSESFIEQPKDLLPYANIIHELVLHFESKDNIIGGCSMGGYISLEYLHRHPRSVNGLILIDTKATPDDMDAKQNRYKTMEMVRNSLVDWGKTDKDENVHESLHIYRQFLNHLHSRIASENTKKNLPDISSQILSIMQKQNPLAIIHALGGMAGRKDTTKTLHRVKIPVLILVGENDILTPPSVAEKMSIGLNEMTLKTIPKAGHLSNLENIDVFNQEFVLWYAQKSGTL